MFENLKLTSLSISILVYLARSPGKQYYQREIARELNSSVGGCHKVLKELRRKGLVKSFKRGKNSYYTINEENPSIKYFKIFTNIQELNDIIEKIKSTSRKIILFGSCAEGMDTLESDIDILVIAEDVEGLRDELLGKFVNGRRIRPIIKAPHEYMKLKNRDRALYNEIEGGLVLWRKSDE
jgi:DNA-binding IscR family transcriptional regulator